MKPSSSIAIYPGSFDPITNGHLDVLERALHLFEKVIFAIAPNEPKKPLFTLEERKAMALEAMANLGERVEVATFEGLLVNFAKSRQAHAIVRGLRAVADFEFEFQLALLNRKLAPDIETVFLTPKDNFICISSSLIKETAKLGGDVSSLVPKNVERCLKAKFNL
ncbi:MAG: pantetheine-phosphate adenylyltransferase [Verrucomicrobiae bacterium]|nr:pantetheine-phosphate adenylyltransferase [Verrucomicrobiae bacterium]